MQLPEHEQPQVQNFLSADLTFEFVQADVGLNGEIFARFSDSQISSSHLANQSIRARLGMYC